MVRSERKASGRSEGPSTEARRSRRRRRRRRRRLLPRLAPLGSMETRSQQRERRRGCLMRLPAELLHHILDRVSLRGLSVFSMVSKQMSRCVVDYISTSSWRSKSIIRSFHSAGQQAESLREHYRQLGLLFKRCTLLLPTKERLKFIFPTFSQVSCFMLDHCSFPNCLGLYSYGVFLQTLIAGWDELECLRVFGFLCDLTNLMHKTQSVITGKQGEKWHQELQLRLFCRKVLLDPLPQTNDRHFWLLQILQPWPMVSQARLLLLLYAPLLPDGSIAWEELVERPLPPTALWELASAILLLFRCLDDKGWTQDTLMSVLEELIASPQPWHEENVARLLLLCGSEVCYQLLAGRALSRRALAVSRLIVYMALVCEKDGYPMSLVVELVQQLSVVFCAAPERSLFIQQLERMFAEVTREFFTLSFIGNQHENQENFQASCFLLDSSARFHTRFLSVLLREE